MAICFCTFILLVQLEVVRIVQKKGFSDKFRDQDGFMQSTREEAQRKNRFGEVRK
jgi:hypothetical protein